MSAVLFVGNISSVANSRFLERLFSAYGTVQKTEVFGDGNQQYAEVTFENMDDADTAIAALHYRYCSTRDIPLVVLYSRNSPIVSSYGRRVGEEFLNCLKQGRMPEYVALNYFDQQFSRSSVILPPPESTVIDGLTHIDENEAK